MWKNKSHSPLFLAILLIVFMFLVGSNLAQDTSGELTVLEWAYYEVPEMWADFGEAYPDVEVTFNFGASDEDIFAKTLAGSGEDIMHFYTPFLKFYVDEGLIQ